MRRRTQPQAQTQAQTAAQAHTDTATGTDTSTDSSAGAHRHRHRQTQAQTAAQAQAHTATDTGTDRHRHRHTDKDKDTYRTVLSILKMNVEITVLRDVTAVPKFGTKMLFISPEEGYIRFLRKSCKLSTKAHVSTYQMTDIQSHRRADLRSPTEDVQSD
jgi:hypothetical protein